MQITAGALCELLNGELEGNPDVIISKPSKIEEGEPGSISFIANPKYEKYAYTTDASALLVGQNFATTEPVKPTLIKVTDVQGSITFLINKFGEELSQEEGDGVSEDAKISEKATIADNVSIGSFAIVESGAKVGEGTYIHPQVFIGKNVKIGKNVTLFPGVKIYRDCEVGDDCIIHSNTVIGSDGFGFLPQKDGTLKKVSQIGNVIIGNDVEIGANTVVDRATMGSTVIKDGVKLDNLIQIGHNVSIDSHTVIAAQAGVAGSTKIGKHCMVGGQVGIVGHIEVADQTKIQAQSGVARAIKKPGTALHGSPAMPYSDFMRSQVIYQRLPDVYSRLVELEKLVKKLQEEA